MRHRLLHRTAIAALACAALAACVPPPEPTPAPIPAPVPAPTPDPVPPPSPAPPFAGSWIDAPLTPGDWSYANGTAQFGEPSSASQLALRCNRSLGAVEIVRAGLTASPVPMVIRSEAMERNVDLAASISDPQGIVAHVPARDLLLDAMAFSKGRFAVEAVGLPTLYVPSYPEVTRVIEDCR